MNFSEMEGTLGYLRVIRISLKPDAKLVKKIPYKLNPKYKEKVKEELDKMLATRIIDLVEEFKQISSMRVQVKKTKGEIRICIDLRKLNYTCVHDPFTTKFTDEVLDQNYLTLFYPLFLLDEVRPILLQMDFSGYHHIIILLEDRHMTTSTIEWG